MHDNLTESDALQGIGGDPLQAIARERFGLSYLFPYQRLVIGNVIEAAAGAVEEGASAGDDDVGHRRQIVILPTGAGKSLCFQLPALVVRGVTLVVFPLLSLIADQERRLKARGIECGVITGGVARDQRRRLLDAVAAGRVSMLLCNPESALQEETLETLRRSDCGHLVIDEAHCVAEWGETFRPIYLRLGELITTCRFRAVSAFTATASPFVLERIRKRLFGDDAVHYIRGNPDRENIRYHVIPSLCKEHDLCSLLTPNGDGVVETRFQRPAIVFCRSRVGAQQTARLLRRRLGSQGIFFYHAGLERDEKRAIEDWFLDAQDGILCSTCAYGMGVDKQNIRTVIHCDLPPSVESYLQESGRAGRDRSMADAILLIAPQDGVDRGRGAGEIERRRFADMVGYARASEGCRRVYLLRLLGAGCDSCSGCDRCDGCDRRQTEAETLITRWVTRHPPTLQRAGGRTAALRTPDPDYAHARLAACCRLGRAARLVCGGSAGRHRDPGVERTHRHPGARNVAWAATAWAPPYHGSVVTRRHRILRCDYHGRAARGSAAGGASVRSNATTRHPPACRGGGLRTTGWIGAYILPIGRLDLCPFGCIPAVRRGRATTGSAGAPSASCVAGRGRLRRPSYPLHVVGVAPLSQLW